MRNTFIKVAQFLLIAGLMFSCSKEEGEGGDGSIVGRVYKVVDDGDIVINGSVFENNSSDYEELMSILEDNNKVLSKIYSKRNLSQSDKDSLIDINAHYFRVLNRMFHFEKDTLVGCDEDVYIVYGNHEYGCDDKVTTSYNGTYSFNYLNEGDYKIFTYNDNVTGKDPIIYDVHVGSGQTYGGDFYINDGKNANLCGAIGYLEVYASKAYDYTPGVDQRVYVRAENSISTSDCRVDDNGLYVFSKLKPNTIYYVWTTTEPEKNAGLYPTMKTFMTGDAGTIVPAPILQADIN